MFGESDGKVKGGRERDDDEISERLLMNSIALRNLLLLISVTHHRA